MIRPSNSTRGLDADSRARVRTYFNEKSGRKAPPLSRNYYDDLHGFVRSQIPPGARVLDLGCGNGDLLASLHPSFGVGADSSSRMVEQAKRRHPNLSFVCADVEEMPISGAFDYVVACNLVGYLSDVWTCFRNLSQVTSPSTRILITHYNFVWEPVLKLASRLGLKSDEPLQNWL